VISARRSKASLMMFWMSLMGWLLMLCLKNWL
jgi:hypothetical protein